MGVPVPHQPAPFHGDILVGRHEKVAACRQIWVFDVSTTVSPSQWRTLLTGSFTTVTPSSSTTKAAKRRAGMKELIGVSLDAFSVQLGSHEELKSVWQDVTYDDEHSVADHVKREILYELYELGFLL